MTTDIAIVGKGMAAMVLATLLKNSGLDFVLLDRQAKVKAFDLAETLPPSVLPLLQNIGLLPLFEKHCVRKTNGYHSLWGSERVVDHNFYFHPPFRYGLKIHKASLLEQMEQQGQFTSLSFQHLLDVKSTADGTQIIYQDQGREKEIHATIVVDATGRNRALLKKLGITSINYDSSCAFSVHLPRKKHPRIKHDVFVESFQAGWGLVSGLNESQNILSVFANAKSPIFQKASDYQHWASILQNTQYLKHFLVDDASIKVRGKKSNSSKAQQTAGANWLSIGDAAMAFDPLSSHGISNAIYTAMKAAESIGLSLTNQSIEEPTSIAPFEEYNQTMNEIFIAYLKSRATLYRSERRWATAAYWKEVVPESQLSLFQTVV